jgi:5-methylcytosine-specific restriction enzyme A
MALSEITREAVEAAISEFRELGRTEFLRRYGFRPARGYFIVAEGRRYDSKAIAGAAHGNIGPEFEPLRPQDFSGGEQTVARHLRRLGFDVPSPGLAGGGSVPFERGRTYHRQRDIHEAFGGQERGGIATPSDVPFIFLFTGESGGKFGYRDRELDDGTFEYTGEGQQGPMEFVRGNRAIRDHRADGKDLLLFEATSPKGFYRFRGLYDCAGWRLEERPQQDGAMRQAIIFLLAPAGIDHDEHQAPPPDLSAKSLSELRQLAYDAASETPQTSIGGEARRAYYLRSAAVKAYVLKRANGKCEACDDDAPFLRKDGTPYLEPHHTMRLADGGPDHPRSVGAVCPTCHRAIHYGQDGEALNTRLQVRLAQLEGQ